MDMRKELLEILACPRCRGQLEVLGKDELEGLCCRACAVVYPVRDDIPVMLVEEAIPLNAWRPGSNTDPARKTRTEE